MVHPWFGVAFAVWGSEISRKSMALQGVKEIIDILEEKGMTSLTVN